MSEHTVPDQATKDEEAAEARLQPSPGAEPTEEEERLADSNTPDPSVAAAEKAANELGANVKGEGETP